MNGNTSHGILIFATVVAIAILAVVFLQSLGKTTISGDHDLPALASGQR
jgi:hypothetical protein